MHKNGVSLLLGGKITEGNCYFPEKLKLLSDLSLEYPSSQAKTQTLCFM